MRVCLVDTWRNVTFPGHPESSAWDTIRNLVKSTKANGTNPHLEFRADGEFYMTLQKEALDRDDDSLQAAEMSKRAAWTKDGVLPVPTFQGIPLVVTGA
jgi:hypothetical protein